MDQPPIHPTRLNIVALDALVDAGCHWRMIPFDREGWDEAVPNNTITTPFGAVDVKPELLDTPDVGVSLIGLIRPVLEDPTYILRNGSTASFHRAVVGPDGAVRGYATVEFVGGRIRLFVSERPPSELLSAGALPPDVTATLFADADEDGDAVFKSCLVSISVSPPSREVSVSGETIILTDCAFAFALLGIEPDDMLKSEHGPIPPDARWITVHPNGEGTKGQPVLVVPAGKEGAFRIIGGAGGKLNMLKLRGVKSEAEYKQQHAERAADARKKRKDQIARDKGLGIHEAKVEARKQITEQRNTARRAFVKLVAEAMNWSPEALEIDTSKLTPEVGKKAESKHERELFKRAVEAVQLQRRALVADAEKRKAAGLGLVPFSAGPEELDVQDLDPGKVSDPTGITVSFGKMAEAHGLTDAKVEAAEAQVAAAAGNPIDPEAKIEKEQVAAALDAQLSKLSQPDLTASLLDAKKSVELLKSLKALRKIEADARAANSAIDVSVTEPKAYVLATTPTTDSEIEQIIKDDLSTAQAAAFLSGVKGVGDEDHLRSQISSGAYNSINALSLTVGGASLVDRVAVDVLGIAGTAQVLASRIRAEYGDKADAIASGLAAYHIETSPERQKEALEQARELQDIAAQIELEEVASPQELPEAVALNQKRLDALGEARAVLGQALGAMEAEAAMIAALEGPNKGEIEVSLGRASVESAMQQLYALGLSDEQFSIDKVEGNMFARINALGIDHLASSVDRENMERVDRNISIMKGSEDEDGWLPGGFANRPDIGLDLPGGVLPKLAVQFDGGAVDLASSLREYIGSRTADGDRAADILSDVQSASFFQKVGKDRATEYGKALDAVIPTKNGKTLTRVEDLAPVFDQYADDFVANKYGGTRSTLNRQKFEPDDIAQEALHRALSSEPAGKFAYMPIGDLSLSDRGKMRDWFFANVAKESPEQADLRHAAEKLAEAEPEKMVQDMFGDMAPNPDWASWKVDYDDAAAKAANAGLDWTRFAKIMGGPVKALESVQDLIRSRVSEKFAESYNRLRPGSPLKVGTAVVRNNLRLLGAIDPVEREKRLSMERSLIDGLRNRVKGKYAGGSVADKIEQHKAYEAAFGQAQMGFFSSDELPGGDEDKPLGADERHTIGHAAEDMIGKMMGAVGKQFEPGQPLKLFQPSMSGPDGVKRQRAVKMIRKNKRVILGAGVGSGKTSMMLGGFSDAFNAGEVKKGLFVVPSIVQGQFGAEALRFLKPGQFQWHAKPGASYEERMASYKDPTNNFTVVTHQSFRDDLLRMAVEAGKASNPEEAAQRLDMMSPDSRTSFMKDVLGHHGISPDYVAVDEGHNLLDRIGKEDSRMSTAIGAVTNLSPFYVHASGDPVKNDASEVFSLLQKMDPKRYSDRDAFMRRYGGDTVAAKDGLRREMARHLYTFELKPDVKVDRAVHKVAVSDAQKAALDNIEKHAASLRISALTGGVDVDAARALSPGMFGGVPEEKHEDLAKRLAKSVGIVKDSAIRKVLDNHPASSKLADLAKYAGDRKGKPGVVFAHSLEAVHSIAKRLEADGHRVITITGHDSSADKADKLRKFNPDAGDAQADIVVASDAGATGANMQSGRWLAQYDCPMTAMTHAQRNGRIARIGQKNDLELLDIVSDHPSDERNRKRIADKYELRDLLTSPLDGIDDTGLAWYLKQAGVNQTEAQHSLL